MLVVGKPGQGKSTYVKRFLADWQRRGLRIIALDVCDEYSVEGNKAALVQLGGLRKRVTVAELAKAPHLVFERRLSLAVVSGEEPRDAARGFLLIAQLVRAAGKPVLVVADEVGLWTDRAADPACHRAEAMLKAMSIGGRKHGVPMVLVAQRAVQVDKTVRSTCTEIHAFYQDEQDDLDALAHRAKSPAFGVEVSQLKEFHCAVWRDTNRGGQVPAATPADTGGPAVRKESNP